MDPATQQRKRRGRRLVWLLVGAIIVLPIGGTLYATFGPNPPIVISKATTHLTTPLDADGLPDYAAALLADMKKGVTPENNGAVPLLQSLWQDESFYSTPRVSKEELKSLCAEIGLPYPPSPELAVTPIDTPEIRLGIVNLLRRHLRVAGPDESTGYGKTFSDRGISANNAKAVQDDRIDEVIYTAFESKARYWSDGNLPFIDEWVRKNQASIDRLVEAAQCPNWYLPSHTMLRSSRGMISQSYVGIQSLRRAVRTLCMRSGYYAGGGQPAEAVTDAIAALRLSQRAGSSQLSNDQMIAAAFCRVSLHQINELASNELTTTRSLAILLSELDEIGLLTDIARAVNSGERLSGLDFAIRAQSIGVSQIGSEYEQDLASDNIDFSWQLFSAAIDRMARRTTIDWNIPMAELNRACNRTVSATRLPTRKQRFDALESLADESTARLSVAQSIQSSWFHQLTPDARGLLVAEYWIGSSFSDFRPALMLEEDLRTLRELTRLHISLAIHRANQGSYPKSLEALIPDILPKLSVDLFNAKPYAYRRTDDGFLLYSLGPNGTDDGGSNGSSLGDLKLEGIEIEATGDPVTGEFSPYDPADQERLDKIPAGADDVSLRVPLPVEPWPWEE